MCAIIRFVILAYDTRLNASKLFIGPTATHLTLRILRTFMCSDHRHKTAFASSLIDKQ